MTDQYQTILYSAKEAFARITLNRPEKRNALNDEMISEVKAALRHADADENLRSVIITGAGNDFCSGADLSALKKISGASISANVEDAQVLMDLFLLIRQVRIPVVAAVRGRALAGGSGLASACDLVLASSSALFGYPEVRIGFVPAMVMAILRRNISEKQAFALLTRGGEISATDARQLGLVNQVFADSDFDMEVEAYVNVFRKLSRTAISLTKSLFYQTDGLVFRDALETGATMNVIARMTEDCQQGIAKFVKKG
jgi:methylglutaconyl-CoA hydratase